MSGLLGRFAALVGLCLFTAGCLSHHPQIPGRLADHLPPPPASAAITPNGLSALPGSGVAGQEDSSEILTLTRARQLTWERDHRLAAAWQEIQVRIALLQQTGLPINPALFAELEEFAGTDDFAGFGNAAGRIGFSREWQSGGKQRLAVQAAETELQEAIFDYQKLQNELAVSVENRFYAVFYLQESLQLKKELLNILDETGRIIEGRINAGENSPLELMKHRSELAAASMAVRQSQRELASARAELAASWGAAEPTFPAVEAQWQKIPQLPLELLQRALTSSPAWQHSRLGIAQAEAALALADSEKYPNLELEGGLQHFREDDSWAFFVGLSLPLALFDRNQGNIAAAQASLQQAVSESAGHELSMQQSLCRAWQLWHDSALAVTELRQETIPAAKDYYDAIYTAYQTGEADILELFAARQDWLTKREVLLERYHECESARLELTAVIGVEDLQHLTIEED